MNESRLILQWNIISCMSSGMGIIMIVARCRVLVDSNIMFSR